ncbi:MAG: hypothetical protein K2K91_09280 [Ruminococcus sp.]|nr:hypothetical protein [Ruminococcus sp.]
MKRLIFVLLCAVCLVSCNKSTENVSVVERTADVPENAVYKQTVTASRDDDKETGAFQKVLNYYDEHDNMILSQRYILTEPEQAMRAEEYEYENGLLVSYSGHGNTTEYEYNSDNNISTEILYIDDEIYKRADYTYENGRLSYIQHYDSDGEKECVSVYEYDEQDRVIRIQKSYDDSESEFMNSWKSYNYDENGNISQEASGDKYNSFVYTYTYDENNRIISGKGYNKSNSGLNINYTYEYEYEFYETEHNYAE